MDNIAELKEIFLKIICDHLSSMEFTEDKWRIVRTKINELEKRYGAIEARFDRLEAIVGELARPRSAPRTLSVNLRDRSMGLGRAGGFCLKKPFGAA